MLESVDPRPRLPPRPARQDAERRSRHPRRSGRARHPVHHRSPRGHRREPGDPASTTIEAIAACHARHGHIQEVIVQNFLPKPGTSMHAAAALPARRVPRGHRLGPLILPPDESTCRPRRTCPTTSASCSMPASTTGAASRRSPPITSTPNAPGLPSIACADVTEAAGRTLAPRLTVYPEFAADPDRWIDPELRFAVLDRADAEGLGRDDPGARLPGRSSERASLRATALR